MGECLSVTKRETPRLIQELEMTTVPFLSCVLLLLHQSSSPSTARCHGREPTSCNCSRQSLQAVPEAPSKLIAELDLSFNGLRTIMRNDFVAFSKKIHDEAFSPLTNLEKLDLSFNRLETLSAGWFESLVSLQHLNLLGNRYTLLGRGNLFQPLKRLKTLHYGGPDLQSVRKGDFSGLRALEEVVFDGKNLRVYAEGSLSQIGPLKYVTLGLNGPFWRNPTLVEAVLSDVVHPDTTLTFTDSRFSTRDQILPFNVARGGGTTSVIFKNVTMTFMACIAFLDIMSDSNLTSLALVDTKILRTSFRGIGYPRQMKRLEALVFRNVAVPQFYNFPALLFLRPLVGVVRRLSLIDSEFFLWPCVYSADFSQLDSVDVSDNLLSDALLSQMMCDGDGGLWRLQTINVSRNHLQTINSRLFTKLNELKNIDLSGNAFHGMPETCYWPPSLQFLNLSSTHLTQVTTCLPVSLRILDLSDNGLTAFNIQLPFLTRLRLSGNKIVRLPDGLLYPRLAFLSIQNNNLQTFSGSNLNPYKDLKILEAAANKYVCSCDFVPGGWILDNIMDAVEKSHRTLFVLSRHFLSSEWCKYELDYTHFRAFDQNDDTVVLILLEPIDKETVPKKFCRLRRVMNSRTYLEWPDDGDRVLGFWHSLKAALKRPDNGSCYLEKVD